MRKVNNDCLEFELGTENSTAVFVYFGGFNVLGKTNRFVPSPVVSGVLCSIENNIVFELIWEQDWQSTKFELVNHARSILLNDLTLNGKLLLV